MRAPRPSERRRTAVLLGECDLALRLVLGEVLAEQGAVVDDAIETVPPDLVLAILSADEPAGVLGAARMLAGDNPVVAVLPMRDDQLFSLAERHGASACYAMDTPIDRLRDVVQALLL